MAFSPVKRRIGPVKRRANSLEIHNSKAAALGIEFHRETFMRLSVGVHADGQSGCKFNLELPSWNFQDLELWSIKIQTAIIEIQEHKPKCKGCLANSRLDFQ